MARKKMSNKFLFDNNNIERYFERYNKSNDAFSSSLVSF